MSLTLCYQNLAKRPVLDLALEPVLANKADVYLLAEPPKHLSSSALQHEEKFVSLINRLLVRKQYATGEQTAILTLCNYSDYTPLRHSNQVKSIFSNKFNVMIYVAYFPISDPNDRVFRSLCKVINSRAKRSILCMDANTHLPILDPGHCHTPRSRKLIERITASNWILHNRQLEYTHHPFDQVSRSSVIDWVITTRDISSGITVEVGPLNHSDHTLITVRYSPPSVADCITNRKNVVLDARRMVKMVSSIRLDPEKYYEQLDHAIQCCLKVKRCKKPDYWNEDLDAARRLWRRVNSKPPPSFRLFKDVMNFNRAYERYVENIAKKYHKKLLQRMNINGFNSLLLHLSKTPAAQRPRLLDDHGDRIRDPQVIGEMILSHFYPLQQSITKYKKRRIFPCQTPPLSYREVMMAIKLQKNTAPGRDKLNAKVIKDIFEASPDQIVDLFNIWLSRNVYPSSYKICSLTVIPKSLELPFDLSNMRPIGLTCNFGKCYEYTLKERLLFYILHTFHPSQFAYLPSRSGVGLLHKLEQVRRLNQFSNKYEVVIALDIAGAFNNVYHSSIIEALRTKGCPQYMINIVSDYLDERYIQISVDNIITRRLMARGVPQGSILGPFLFIAALDEAIKSFESKCAAENMDIFLFADDVTLVLTFDQPCPKQQLKVKINSVLRSLSAKLSPIGLSLNRSKTKLLFNSRWATSNINSKSYNRVRDLSVLGLKLSRQGTYLPHVKMVCSEALQLVDSLSRYFSGHFSLPTPTRIHVLNTRIYPIISYASCVWLRSDNDEYASIIDKLRETHGRLIRRIFCTFPSTPYYVTLLLTKQLPLHLQVVKRAVIDTTVLRGFSTSFNTEVGQKKMLNHLLHPRTMLTLSYYHFEHLSVDDLSLFHFVIYTDGSRCQQYSRSAFQVYRISTDSLVCSRLFSLPAFASSYQCEAAAIMLAIDSTLSASNRKYLIVTDSQSCLSTLVAGYRTDPLITAAHKSIITGVSMGNCYSFAWIRSKTGRNLLVDELCKGDGSMTDVLLPVSSSTISTQVDLEMNKLLEEEYLISSKHSYVQRFFPSIHESRHQSVVFNRSTVQLFSGHGGFRTCLSRSDPNCICGVLQDPLHLLFSCTLTRDIVVKAARALKISQLPSTPAEISSFCTTSQCYQLIQRVAWAVINKALSERGWNSQVRRTHMARKRKLSR